ncbi:hypothetical protein WYH_01078 [Croceibacterium atlanticum]|uniref:Uncharacterized protein n=1 Tax=Croceibacterium atlanticum TaxID=1267766 RepID=A0A0F7KTJ6_9SPHN|nr:hypothetical protein WYH_01078 [Croceibacterium atlanticum]
MWANNVEGSCTSDAREFTSWRVESDTSAVSALKAEPYLVSADSGLVGSACKAIMPSIASTRSLKEAGRAEPSFTPWKV